jgi:hypothetical protein
MTKWLRRIGYAIRARRARLIRAVSLIRGSRRRLLHNGNGGFE